MHLLSISTSFNQTQKANRQFYCILLLNIKSSVIFIFINWISTSSNIPIIEQRLTIVQIYFPRTKQSFYQLNRFNFHKLCSRHSSPFKTINLFPIQNFCILSSFFPRISQHFHSRRQQSFNLHCESENKLFKWI